MSIIPQKHCPKCGRDLPHSDFHRNKRRHDGLASYCKSCFATLDKERNAVRRPKKEGPEPKKKQYKRGVAERRSEQAETKARMRSAPTKICKRCGEERPKSDYTEDDRYADGCYPWCAECRREWRQGRKSKQLELRREWYHRDVGHARAYGRKYYHDHKEAIAPKRRIYDRTRYRTDHEFKRRKDIQTAEKNRRRKALLYGAPTEHHTEEEWQQLCEKYDHRCLRCGLQVPLSRDHIIPVTKGGSDAITNLQPLCKVCNSWKNNRTIDFRPDV